MGMLVASKSAVNKMDAANVARSLAPGLMRSETNADNMMAVVKEKKSERCFQAKKSNYCVLSWRQVMRATTCSSI